MVILLSIGLNVIIVLIVLKKKIGDITKKMELGVLIVVYHLKFFVILI